MRKINRVQSTLLIVALAIACLPVPVVVTIAKTQLVSQELSWDAIEGLLGRQKSRKGGRGSICLIAPGALDDMEVWSDRPLLIWQGRIRRIEVRPQGGQKALWRHPVTGTERSALYGGKALQSGQTYDWMVFDDSNESSYPTLRSTFRVMDVVKRDRIAADLKAMETKLQAKGTNPEEVALQKANYFAERQLWSDVLQEAFSVRHPSTALTSLRQIPHQICSAAKVRRDS